MTESKRIAFLGPEGTFSEQACITFDPSATRVPFPSITSAAAAVDSGQADEAIVPIENSLEGAVTDTLDLLIHDSALFIRQELVLPIQHVLVAAPGTGSKDIRAIYSHPQALAQCRSFLSENYPGAELLASMSTAAAVGQVLERKGDAAAIANERASSIYGADVLARGIEDNRNNVTRFVVLATTDHSRTGADKTSLCFSFDEDAPGVLHAALGEFATRGINLEKIESRPTKESLGRYIFLVDLEGHREDTIVQQALSRVQDQVSGLKVFGSYPRYRLPSAGGPG